MTAIDDDLWDDFCAHRSEIKKPMSELAKKRMRNRIERYAAQGHDITEMLERSISCGWQDIYPPDKGPTRTPGRGATALPDYGERSAPETARTAVRQAMRLVKRGR